MSVRKRLLRSMGHSRKAFLSTLICAVLLTLFIILEARLVTEIIARVFLSGQLRDELLPIFGILLLALSLRALAAGGLEKFAAEIPLAIKTHFRQQLYQRIAAQGPAFLQKNRSAALLSLAGQGIDALDGFYSQYLPQMVLALLTPLAILLVIFSVDPLSGLILLVTAPLIPLFMLLIGDLSKAQTERHWLELTRLSSHFLDVIQGLATLKMFGRSRAQASVIERVGQRFRETTMQVLRVAFLSSLTLELAATLSTALVAVSIGLRLLAGGLTFEQAFFVLLLAPEFFLPLRRFGAAFHTSMESLETGKQLYEILDAGPLPEPSPSGDPALPTPAALPEIEFQQVSFHYPPEGEAGAGASQAGVQELSFTLRTGQITALVGPTGAGKSTIQSLLMKFLLPQAGEILAAGRPLSAWADEDWRNQLAWVPQRPHLFQGTIEDNIKLARPGSSPAEVENAAAQAGLHDFVLSLAAGYQTQVGEKGARLSGGQLQRIALARAFLKDAPLLLLDEPSAHLDAQLEQQLNQILAAQASRRITFVIAHRLKSILQANQVLVLDQGRLVAAGTHAQLLQSSPLYARLIETSFSSEAVSPLPAGQPPEFTEPPAPELPRPRPKLEKQPALRPIWELLRLARPYPRQLLLAVLYAMLAHFSGLGMLAVSAYVISAAALHPPISSLQAAIALIRLFSISRGGFRYLERLVAHDLTFRLLTNLRTHFYRRLEPLAPARLIDLHSADLLQRMLADLKNLENFYLRGLGPALTALLSTLVVMLVLGAAGPWLPALLILASLLIGVGLPLLVHLLSRAPAQALETARLQLQLHLLDGLQGLADLLAANGVGRQTAQISAASQAAGRAQARLGSVEGLQTALVTLLSHLSLLLILWLAAPLVTAGLIPGVLFGALALLVLGSFEVVAPLPGAAKHLQSSRSSARRLLEVVQAQPAVSEPAEPLPIPTQPALELRALHFRYPNASMLALENLSFELPYGKHLAIVGPSGAGKSSLLNLLLRFWDYEQGEILWAGKDLSRYAGESLRGLLAVVPQQIHIFNATLRENLRIGNPQANPEELHSALRESGLEDFTSALPLGLETWAGEHGFRLSGGERQRLGIARALLRQAPIILLDEPTAHLDATTARRVLDNILRLYSGKSLLLISHQTHALERMDEILVMERGRIVQRGCHAELIDQPGLYRRLWLSAQPGGNQ